MAPQLLSLWCRPMEPVSPVQFSTQTPPLPPPATRVAVPPGLNMPLDPPIAPSNYSPLAHQGISWVGSKWDIFGWKIVRLSGRTRPTLLRPWKIWVRLRHEGAWDTNRSSSTLLMLPMWFSGKFNSYKKAFCKINFWSKWFWLGKSSSNTFFRHKYHMIKFGYCKN